LRSIGIVGVVGIVGIVEIAELFDEINLGEELHKRIKKYCMMHRVPYDVKDDGLK
jgi:hypothetical protein